MPAAPQKLFREVGSFFHSLALFFSGNITGLLALTGLPARWRWDWRPPSGQPLYFWVVLVQEGSKCLFSAQGNRHLPWESHPKPGCKKCWLNLPNKQQLFGCALLWTSGLLGWRGTAQCLSHVLCGCTEPSQPVPVGSRDSAGSGSSEGSLGECQEGGWALCQSHGGARGWVQPWWSCLCTPVKCAVSSSEPRAAGSSRGSLKGRSSPALGHLQSQFRVLLNFYCISTAGKWKTQMLSGITVKLGCRSRLPCPFHHLKMTRYLWGESGLTQSDCSFPSSLVLRWAGKGILLYLRRAHFCICSKMCS